MQRPMSWFGSAVLLALFVVTLACPAAAMDVTQLLSRVQQATSPGKDMRANVDFEMTNATGESIHWAGTLYRRNVPDRRVRLVLDSPVDLRGTEVVLMPGSDNVSQTRIFLPGLRRWRNIQADMRGEAFLGTDFNYEDLGFQHMEFQEHKLESYDEESRDCYRVASIPQEGWWYARIVRCIDKKTYLPLRTEYYNRTGTLWKVRTLDGVKTIKSFPTASRITMQTIPTGTQTRITLSEIQYDSGLPDALFEGR